MRAALASRCYEVAAAAAAATRVSVRNLHHGVSSRDVNIQQIVDAQLHMGHSTERWNAHALPYLLGERSNLHIINPTNTLAGLRRAANFLTEVARRDGIVLFVGTRGGSSFTARSGSARRDGFDVCALASDAAHYAGQYYVHRWTPGMLTNAFEVVARHQQLPTYRPDAVVLLNAKDNMKAVREARKALVPTIAVVDSDMDPRMVSYPIPGNDESMLGMELVASVLAEAARTTRP
ncbi:hypothetical protein RI367_004022 [Sorochytrium milnesiophthora]